MAEQIQADIRWIMEHASIGMAITSLDGHYIFVNDSLCNILGYSREELDALTYRDITHPDDLRLGEEERNRMRAGQLSSYRIDAKRYVRKDGRVVWLRLAVSLVRDEHGEPLCFFGQQEDVSERLRIESELRNSEEKFQTLFESASDGMLLLDMEGRILDVNRTGHERLGYTKAEMVGKHVSEIDPPEFAHKVPERMQALIRDGHAQFESGHVCKDGKVLPVEINARMINLGGKPLCFSVVRDITERKLFDNYMSAREARYRAVIETSSDGFIMTDCEGRILEVNDTFSRLSGYGRRELIGKRMFDLADPGEIEQSRANMVRVLADGHNRFECRQRTRDGRSIQIEVQASYWLLEGGRVFAFVRDITERKRHDEAMKLAALVFENSNEAMCVTDEEERIIAVNPAFTRMTGYAPEEIIGQMPTLLQPIWQDTDQYREMWQALNSSGYWQGEIWDRRKDGEAFAEWLNISTIYNEDGSLHRRVAQFSDITNKKNSEDLIWRQANYDALTQLPNRRMFRDRLEQEIKKASRDGDSVGLFFIDLDFFKEINDTLGHHIGDALLVEAAQRIQACVREMDTVARLGGDEFTVILTELKEEARVERAAQAILKRLKEPFHLGEDVVYVSASIGITLFPSDASNSDDMIKHADQAMYVAKEKGRNRFSFYTPTLEQAAQSRLRLIGELRNSVVDKDFKLHFQPIVELSSGEVKKAEALIRWQHPQRGMISPLEFIPIAEETGLINEIGDWVFRESASWAKQWAESYAGGVQISVNKSPVQFMADTDDRASWLHELERLELHGSKIAIEITEGLLLDADSRVSKLMLRLRDAGVQFAIDDFGTGYSSLSYLKKFNLNHLKIDRSFVSNLETDPDNQALCEAIIVMSHKLGLKVIAEGIETQSQFEMLREMGCDFGQGYWFSKPMAPEEFERRFLRP